MDCTNFNKELQNSTNTDIIKKIDKKLQHTQLPTDEKYDTLTPKDKLIYLYIKSYDNPQHECYPSLRTLAERSGISVPTIRKCINNLQDNKYLEVQKKGKKNYYIFNKYKKFEPFSKDFLDNKELSTKTKSMIVAAQQYMFKDEKDKGKISLTNEELSNKIHMPIREIYECNKELTSKGLLSTQRNKSLALDGTELKSNTKIYDMKNIGQAVIWKLKDHEDRITNLERALAENNNEDTIRRISSEIIKSELTKQIADKFREQDLKFQQQSEQINNLTKAIYLLAQNLSNKN